jgi:hypothetical protein
VFEESLDTLSEGTTGGVVENSVSVNINWLIFGVKLTSITF